MIDTGRNTLDTAIHSWFRSRFSEFTEIQREALPHTLGAENTLILAPTGSGKTLAAFLSVLSELAHMARGKGLPNATCAVYVSPLKALGRDIRRNLEAPLSAVNEALPRDRRIRMDVRTGDTNPLERGRQQRHHPHLLITTPESLSAILSQSGWREHGFDPRVAIVDEIHALAENKRGSLLALALERLEARAQSPMQRIGLSATAWPVDAVQRFLCGSRPCAVASVDVRRAHRLDIATPLPERSLPPAGHSPYRIAHTAAELVERAQCTLIFTSTRSAAERLALALKILLPEHEEGIAVHHASVDARERFDIETGLSDGSLKAVVCSTSLELGVDFAAVDQVLLIGAPRGVSRALQRLGRGGHRINGIAEGSLIPVSLPDLVECVALRDAAITGRLDALRVPQAPLDVLAQALLGMSIERAWPLDQAYAVVRRAGSYEQLTREDFDAVIEYLGGGGRVLGSYGSYGRILVEDASFRVASQKVARTYYMNTGVISEDVMVKVIGRGHRKIGQVEESFLTSLQPGEAFILGGRSVAVATMLQGTAVVEPAKGERVKTPRWMGSRMPLTARLANEELRLRQSLRAAWERGGPDACRRTLEQDWGAPADAADRVLSYIGHQYRAAPLPVDAPMQIERVREGRTLLMLFHIVAGRSVNRSLAWVLGYRLFNGSSVVSNADDHSLLLSINARQAPDEAAIRQAFNPRGFREDLRRMLEKTETLGRKFRSIAEIGQLLPRRTFRGNVPAKSASWSGSLLYKTLLEYEPGHPLVRECIREALEDECDADRAGREAARIFETSFEAYDLPRPSPFALPLFAAFNRETLMAQDPEAALDELVTRLYGEWER